MKTHERKNLHSHLAQGKGTAYRILIVDDSKSSRETLEDLFLQEGYEVIVASSGLEAIDILRGSEIHLVITDLKMPGMDGIQVLKESMRINKNIAVIIITGYASLDSAIESIREGAYGYVKKPFDLDEMIIIVDKALERIRIVQENLKLQERIRRLESEMEGLMKKKEEMDNELKRVLNMLSVQPIHQDSDRDLNHLVPFNRLPYNILRDKDRKGFDPFRTIWKLGWMRKEGLLEEEEFRVIKKRLMERI